MPEKKVIAVVGATGAQGGGLVRAILADPTGEFAARAITRDPGSEKAQELAALGAEVVAGDVDDEASLRAAFAGAHGAFCVTFFWAHFSPELELQHAANMANAAKAAGVSHVIWSTLEDTREFIPLSDDRMPTLGEHYNVPHYDAKGEANHFFTDAGLPVTFLQTSFYWDNFIYFGMGPARGEDGGLSLTFPIADGRVAGIASEDIGAAAYGIFKAGSEFVGKTVSIAGEHLTGEQMAAGFSRLTGEPVAFNAVSPEAYRGFGFPGAEDLGNMFQFTTEFEDSYCGRRDIEATRALNPGLKSFDQWLDAYGSQVPVP
jgi:uncharacterized protein YbjT (DUF2867 family)